MKRGYKKGGISSNLGCIQVEWRPFKLDLPANLPTVIPALGSIQAHGPLVLSSPSFVRFKGPLCYVENAPFEAELEQISTKLAVGVPFEIYYSLRNNTDVHQTVSISMQVPSAGMQQAHTSNVLVAGTTRGQLSLGPLEGQTVSFTVVATKPGYVEMPALHIASDRHQTWVVQDKGRRPFVFP